VRAKLPRPLQTIHVQAYAFTSQPIARVLTDAEKRGVEDIAILDASNRTKKYSAASFRPRPPGFAYGARLIEAARKRDP
jgi:phosphatidylserine/phosphatidylglycerophosphate/cardiolipin synthase-like enzyme